MKKNKLFTIAVLMGAGLSMASCSDFLEANNKSAGSDADTYFATEEGKAAARTKAYYSLQATAENFNLYCDGTDLYIPVRGKTPSEYARYSVVSNDKNLQSYYSDCYNLVKYAMFYAEKSGEGTQGEAEGRFLRDYAYYLLTQQFGGVPYVDHYVSSAEREFPKASLDSIYTVMESDLEAIYNSSVLPETDHKGGASKQAVASLLAKFYLAHGWDIDTKVDDAAHGTYTVNSTANFAKAAQWAKTAINNQTLTQTFEQKWSPFNEGNDEQIWSIQYERAGYPGSGNGGHNLQAAYGNYYGEPKAVGQKGVGSTGQASEKAIYLWQPGDDRYEATFMTKMYNYKSDLDNDGKDTGKNWGTTGYFAYYNADAAALENMPFAYRFYPYYTTEAQVREDIAAHPENFTQGDYHNGIEAYIVANPMIHFIIKDGKVASRSTVTYDHNINLVGGGPTVKKFDDAATQQVDQLKNGDYRDIVVFDLSDMYLTVAEAELMAGNETEALKYVNDVRNRSHAGALASFGAYEPAYSLPSSFGDITPLDVILDERARELYGEQTRWVDLRRTKQLVRYNVAFNEFISSVADMTGPDGNIKWLRPIPQAAIDGNVSMSEDDQNPGY